MVQLNRGSDRGAGKQAARCWFYLAECCVRSSAAAEIEASWQLSEQQNLQWFQESFVVPTSVNNRTGTTRSRSPATAANGGPVRDGISRTRNRKYEAIDQTLREIAEAKPKSQEEVFKQLDGGVHGRVPAIEKCSNGAKRLTIPVGTSVFPLLMLLVAPRARLRCTDHPTSGTEFHPAGKWAFCREQCRLRPREAWTEAARADVKKTDLQTDEEPLESLPAVPVARHQISG